MTIICKNCLVELDAEMAACPLCGTAVNDNAETGKRTHMPTGGTRTKLVGDEKYMMQRILWQVTATILLSGIVATLIVDVVVHNRITWSLYPMTICLVILSYASVLAFWRKRAMLQILAGWVLSTIILIVIHQFIPEARWTTSLAVPLLIAVNVIALALLSVFKATRTRGLNLLAYSFVGIAVLCLAIEGIISQHFTGETDLGWSIIVVACLLPVTAVLIFMFYRTRNNPTIQKIFHT